MFNALTGARRTMGNWPGTTVEVGRGAWRVGETTIDLIDLPGAYSLDPASPDEELTRALLVDVPPAERPDVVVVLVDAAHLSRSLYIVSQLREQAANLIVALTMNDVAARRGVTVDVLALSAAVGAPVVALDPRRRGGGSDLANAVTAALKHGHRSAARPVPPDLDEFDAADERFAWVDGAVAAAVVRSTDVRRTWSDRIDRVALSRLGGPLIFLAAMWATFQLTTTIAAPLQELLGTLFSGPVSDGATWLLGLIGLDNTVVYGFVVKGLIAGVGMLLTFAPLMAVMFLILSVLEDSGYMARAAVVADRLMRLIGLPGRAFLPLIVGFGCNVPAISATRVMSGARQRTLTALLVPFTSCSARLTVYVLVATTFFPNYAGSVVFAMYVLSILLVVGCGFALKKTLWRTMGNEPLMLDLPPYQRPTLRLMGSMTWVKLRGFLRTASGIIVVTVCLVWLLQAVPTKSGESFGEVPVADSAYATVAKAISPIFEPAGFGQWQTTGALVTGFVAKEAVISSWAQTYAVQDPAAGDSAPLADAIRADFEKSSGGHTIPAVFAFLVFLLAYTPCVATLAAQKREIGIRWTIFGVGMQLTVAWVLAVAVFQIGRLFL